MDIFYYFSKKNNTSGNPKPVRLKMYDSLNIGDKFNFIESDYNQLSKSMQSDFDYQNMELGIYTVVDKRLSNEDNPEAAYVYELISLER